MGRTPHGVRLPLPSLPRSFALFVLALAVYMIGANTADPDLWGHVIYGQRTVALGHVEKAEPFSWTAAGYRWSNHETLAEVSMGLVHAALGGTGLFLLKLAVGMVTFLWALRLGMRGLDGAWRAAAWAVAMIAVVELAFGFAPRPQIFTALGMVALFAAIRATVNRSPLWALTIPPLCVLWINTHGGVLAGIVLLVVAAAAETAVLVCRPLAATLGFKPTEWKTVGALWAALVLTVPALCLNPWGPDLPLWLVETVRWGTRRITEWQPTPLGLDHAMTFVMGALVLAAVAGCRTKRHAWEVAVMLGLLVMAIRHVRHTALFGIAVLSFLPPYAASAMRRLEGQTRRLRETVSRVSVARMLRGGLVALAALIVVCFFTLHKSRPFTIEVPRDAYPVGGIRFVRQHELTGNLFVFFNWAQMALWELPDCPPSLDGRLDTCYPRSVIDANWDLYEGRIPPQDVMRLDAGDLALLPPDLPGTAMLLRQPGWRAVYLDATSAVLVRDAQRFPRLSGLRLPVEAGEDATTGRVPFPDRRSRNSYPAPR